MFRWLTKQRQSSTLTLGNMAKRVEKSEEEWKKALSKEEYRVLRQKGTEAPGSGEYNKKFPTGGYFACRACGNPLYTAEAKFDSGCGWPAFDKCLAGSIQTKSDRTFGMIRTEIMCAACDGHLGHVFVGENFKKSRTSERHCVNSISVKFVKGTLNNVQETTVG